MNYRESKAFAPAIKAAVQSRYMPPWKPVHGVGEFQNERRLSDEEIDKLVRWVDAGAPEGDSHQRPAPLIFSPD